MKTSMIRICFATVALVAGSLQVCRAQEALPLKFDETEWDFGAIREEAGNVTREFGFVNGGASPLVIERVEVTCGCTTPKYPREPVKAGERSAISVSFDPTGYSGEFYKSISVVSGGGKHRYILTISGNITPREKTVEEVFPYEMAGGVRFDRTVLPFRQVAQGGAYSMVVKYVNTSPKTVSLKLRTAENGGLLEIHAPETICAGCSGDITLTYNLAGKSGSYGLISDNVEAVVDGMVSGNLLQISMIGVDNFSGSRVDNSPRGALSAMHCNFGEIGRGPLPRTERLVLRNEGRQTLIIRSISEKPGLKTTLRSGMTVAPGAELPFELLLYTNKYDSGELLESIVLVLNDPLRPVRELRVAAKIR